MGQFCSCFKSTAVIPIKEEKLINSPMMNVASLGASKYASYDEDPKSPGSVISTPRSSYPELRIKIPIEKEIIFDDDKTLGAKRYDDNRYDNNYRNKYKKKRLC
jgi:hypothetical protein